MKSEAKREEPQPWYEEVLHNISAHMTVQRTISSLGFDWILTLDIYEGTN